MSIVSHLGHHEEADEHEGRGSGLGRDQFDKRSQEGREQEEDTGDHGGQAGARALSDARGGLDVGGVRGDAADAAGHGGRGSR